MDIIDFHTHPYLTQEENACMYREGFSLEPEEAKEDLLQAGIGRICGSVYGLGKGVFTGRAYHYRHGSWAENAGYSRD